MNVEGKIQQSHTQHLSDNVVNVRITNLYSTCLTPSSPLPSSRQQQLQLPQTPRRPARKPPAPRAPLTPPSSAPKVPKRDATGEEKRKRRRAKGPMRGSLNPSHRTASRKLAVTSLWMQTS